MGGRRAAQAGGIESNRRRHMFGLRGSRTIRGGAVFGRKRRVVMHFDKLNKETLKSAFRYETLKSLRHLAKKGDWAISFDLEDGFHAILIHPDDRK